MDFTSTLKLINKRMEMLEEKQEIYEKKIDVINNFITEFKFSNAEQIANIDIIAVASAVMYLANNDINLEELEILFKESGVLEVDDESVTDALMAVFEKYDEKKGVLRKVTTALIERSGVKFKLLEQIYNMAPEAFLVALNYIISVNNFKVGYLSVKSVMLEDEDLSFLTTKEKKRFSTEFFDEVTDFKQLKEALITLQTDYSTFYKTTVTKRKTYSREFNDLRYVVDYIKKNDTLTESAAKDLVNRIQFQNIKNLFLVELKANLLEEKEKLEKKVNLLSGEGDVKTKALFNDYGYDFNQLSEEARECDYELESLSELLKGIKKLDITDYEDISYLLINSNKGIINNIIKLIANGVLSSSFIANNLDFMNSDKDANVNHEHMLNIMRLFESFKLNKKIFIVDQSIYYMNIDDLKNKLSILESYNLLGSLKTCTSFEFLKSNDFVYKIDQYLELGYEDILVNNMDLLNVPESLIKRLILLESVGDKPSTLEDITKVFNDSNFIVLDEEIDSFIPDVTSDFIPDKQRVDMKSGTNVNIEMKRTIDIGGNIISAVKFARNLSCIPEGSVSNDEREIYASLYGTHHTYSKVDSIIEGVKEKNRGK